MRTFWKLFLLLAGWNAAGPLPVGYRRAVFIVAPHTSNWDFVFGLAFRSVLKLNHAKFLGKKELFRPPFGFVFHWLGGYPVDRSSSNNLVDEVVRLFEIHKDFTIALSPEGTRKRVDKLKTGFYHIAHKAGVPIIMAALDYRNRQALFREPFFTTGNLEADLGNILEFYRPIEGRNPKKGLMHL
jgi:1-acyl-sn-glycerol-3-phosphate acyltransferase